MALGTVTKVKQGVFGDTRYTICDVQPTSGANYTTGGEPFTVANVPGATGTILGVFWLGGGALNANQHVPKYDVVNKKLMMFRAVDATTVGLAEAASNADLSAAGANVRLLILSK